MDTKVLFNLTYGLYIVGVMDGDRPAGCVINTCFQVTSKNPVLAISLNKDNYTNEVIHRNPRFVLSILSEESNPALITVFGFQSSRTVNKYKDFGYDKSDGVPMVTGRFSGRLILDAFQFVDCGTHEVILARLADTVAGSGTPMTYSYYHKVIKGSAPKNAPTYVEEKADSQNNSSDNKPNAGKINRFRCDICGYIAETSEESLPSDYRCPICNADITHFHLLPE